MQDAQGSGISRTTKRREPCASNPDTPWFCVHTKPQMESATERRIRDERSPVWLPLHATGKPKELRISPIFPRYLFVQAYPWTVVRNAGGEEMARLLTSPTTGRPIAIASGVIESWMAGCGPDGIIYPPEPRQITFKDNVRVEDGPFAGFSGICRRTTRDRVWLLLSLFGRLSEVPFTRGQVELIA